MTNLPELSVKQLRRAVALREKIESLEAKITSIMGESGGSRAGAREKAGQPKRKVSAATRAKLAAKAKVRWASAKAAGRSKL
ncbi:MAG TPA: hypothetical protein VGO59_14855 [Verrucomicrobiae bacterium]|jgi:hypothetical protein